MLLGSPAWPAGAAPPTPLRAGAATVPLRVLAGTPLGGYGALSRRLLFPDLLGRHPHAFWFRPHHGVLDAPAGRALVLEQGRTRIVWFSADLIAVDGAFVGRLAARLRAEGVEPGTLIVSASHTHSGPGAFLDFGLLGQVGVDRLDEPVRDALVASLAEAGRRAASGMVEARVGSVGLPGPPLTVGRLGLPVDQELVVVKIVAETGAPVAAVWNFAIHPTMLPPSNLRLSGDVTGMASRAIEADLGVPALYVNGAVGDVSPQGHGLAAAREASLRLARAVRAAWERTVARDRGPLLVASRRAGLPAPRLSARNCLGTWVPRSVEIPLPSWLPAGGDLVAAALGHVAWVTLPGELQSSLGERIKAGIAASGRHGFVAGLSNGYLAYFVTGADYGHPTYVSCASLYGPAGGERLTEAAIDLVRTLPAAPAGARSPSGAGGGGQERGARLRASADFLRAAVLR